MSTADDARWQDLADREAAGDELTEEERSFIVRYAEQRDECRAELRLWSQMAQLGGSTDELREHAIARRAVDAALGVAPPARPGVAPRRSLRALRVAIAGGALAVAAGAALLLGRHEPARAPFASGSGVGATIVSAGGDVRIGGVPAARGTVVSEGSEVAVTRGTACLVLPSTIHVCLGSGTRVRVGTLTAPRRHVDLLKGRVAVALSPLAAGERFSVVANGVWSTAVGTAFTVELEESGAVETVVHEGKVRVGGEEDGPIVPMHKLGLATGGGVEVEPSPVPDESIEWAALEAVRGRDLDMALEGRAPVEPTVQPSRAPSEESAPAAAVGAQRTGHVSAEQLSAGQPEPPAPEPAAEIVPAPSPDSMLAEARSAMRAGRWPDAAEAYRKLRAAFPASAEAHTVLVPLAEIEVDHLGHPALARSLLDAYILKGGPLVHEARLARIRALRALGDTAAEASAIEDFLSAHPGSLEANTLRLRRQALGGR